MEIAPDDIVDVDDAHEAAGLAMNDEKAVVRTGLELFQMPGKSCPGFGLGTDPVAMNRPTPADSGKKGGTVAEGRRSDAHAFFGDFIHSLFHSSPVRLGSSTLD